MKHTKLSLAFLEDALLQKKKINTTGFFMVIFTMAPNFMT